MAVALRATAADYDNNLNLAVTIPAEVQTGDLLILAFGIAASDATVTTPEGWNLQDSQADNGDVWRLFVKAATSADAGSTVTVSCDSSTPGAHMGALLYAVSGVDSGDPFNDFQAEVETTSSATHTAPDVTTTADDCLLVAIMLDRTASPSTDFTASSGWTVQQQLKPSFTASVMEGCIADAAAGSLGAQTGPTLTATKASGHTALWTLALAPATAAQTVRPASDITATGWTPTPEADPLALNLGDSSDATYIESPTNPNGSVYEDKFPAPAAVPAQIQTRYALAGGATSGTVVTSLRQGGTEIAAWTDDDPPTSPTTYTYTLTGEQQDAITDLTDLRLRTTVTAS